MATRSARRTPPFSAEVESITPAQAAEMLACNHSNRGLRRSLVNMLTREILSGNWQLTGEAIKFDQGGNLIDGQHRLSAIVAADTTVPVLVIRNLPTTVQKVLDTGAKRSAGDALKLGGFTKVNLAASTARILFLYDQGLLYDYAAHAVSNTDILDYAMENDAALNAAVAGSARVYRNVPSHPSAVAAGIFITARVDQEASDEFFDMLSTGIGLTTGSPIVALISRLRELDRKKTRVANVDHLSLVLRAWNLWRTGKSVASLFLYSNDGSKTPIKVPTRIA